MPSFAHAVVIAGALVFAGGLLALGAQNAGRVGMPRPVVLASAWSAAAAMLAAVALVVMGMHASVPVPTHTAAAMDAVMN